MVNTALEKYRLHYRLVSMDETLAHHEAEESENISSEIDAQELLRIIQELSPRYRVVFNLYALEGFSHKEIGDMLGISEELQI
jgi:RNA polymerase sigma-70 factor (ECF subfamily)